MLYGLPTMKITSLLTLHVASFRQSPTWSSNVWFASLLRPYSQSVLGAPSLKFSLSCAPTNRRGAVPVCNGQRRQHRACHRRMQSFNGCTTCARAERYFIGGVDKILTNNTFHPVERRYLRLQGQDFSRGSAQTPSASQRQVQAGGEQRFEVDRRVDQ